MDSVVEARAASTTAMVVVVRLVSMVIRVVAVERAVITVVDAVVVVTMVTAVVEDFTMVVVVVSATTIARQTVFTMEEVSRAEIEGSMAGSVGNREVLHPAPVLTTPLIYKLLNHKPILIVILFLPVQGM